MRCYHNEIIVHIFSDCIDSREAAADAQCQLPALADLFLEKSKTFNILP